jgi:uncharacterized protein YkwD
MMHAAGTGGTGPSLRRGMRAVGLACSLMLGLGAVTAFETRSVALINGHRTVNGRAALAVDTNLYRLAKAHSDYMASRRALGHDGFRSRMSRSGFSFCVENVGWNHPTPEILVSGWRRSSGHNTNMLNAQTRRVGIARTGSYVTMLACG